MEVVLAPQDTNEVLEVGSVMDNGVIMQVDNPFTGLETTLSTALMQYVDIDRLIHDTWIYQVCSLCGAIYVCVCKYCFFFFFLNAPRKIHKW